MSKTTRQVLVAFDERIGRGLDNLFAKKELGLLTKEIERVVKKYPHLICGLEIECFVFDRRKKTRLSIRSGKIRILRGELESIYWIKPEFLAEMSAAKTEREKDRLFKNFRGNSKIPKRVVVGFGTSLRDKK